MTWLGRFGRLVVALGVCSVGIGVLNPPAAQALVFGQPMTIEIDLSRGSGLRVKLPLDNGITPTTVRVDWGTPTCGTQDYVATVPAPLSTLDIACTYAAAALVQINVSVAAGNTVQWFGGNGPTVGAEKFIEVLSWGDLGLLSLYGAFTGMINLVDVPANLPTGVTDLTSTFSGTTSFNDVDVSSWNTSNVTDMTNTFGGASSFNQPLATWDTSNVVSMSGMFNRASAFNQPISNWNVSNVTGMSYMFAATTSFNQPINSWNTSSVTSMVGMFNNAAAFNRPLSSWNTSNVLFMNDMFNGAAVFDQDIGGWDVSSLIDARAMFQSAAAFNRSLNGWSIAGLADLVYASNMFRGAPLFNNGCSSDPCVIPFSWPNAPSLLEVGGMFADANSFNAPIAIDTDQVVSFAEMFWGAGSFNNGCGAGDPSCPLAMITPELVTTSQMFEGAVSFNQQITFSSTAKITNSGRMFASAIQFNNGCDLLDPVPANWVTCPLDLNGAAAQPNFGALISAGGAFAGASSFNQNLNSWNMSTVTGMGAMFYNQGPFNNGCLPLDQSCPLTWTTSSLVSMGEMFYGAVDFNQALPNFDTDQVLSMFGVFGFASSFDQDISGWTVRQVTNMEGMFRAATAFDQNLSSWCFNGSVTNTNFALGAGFELLTAKHPKWSGCPVPVVIVPVTTSTTPPSTTTPPTTATPSVQPSLPATGNDSSLALIALLLVVAGLVAVGLRVRGDETV